MESFSNNFTIEAICAVRASYKYELKDSYSESIIEFLPEAQKNCEILNKISRGKFSRTILLRSLFFRKVMIEAAHSVSQIIILNAGLDPKPLSIDSLKKSTKIFYVDSSYLCDFTKKIFNQLNICVNNINFIPYSFNGDSVKLIEELKKVEVDFSSPTLILWEGASYYFEPEIIYQLISNISKEFEKLNFAFDFLNKCDYFKNNAPITLAIKKKLEFLESIGEPWKGFVELRKMLMILNKCGFHSIEVKSREKLEEELLNYVKMTKGQRFFANISNY
jgi:O-methyltransferase involved in polyketide biosynthesis